VGRFATTLTALAAPRRAIPIAAVAASLVAVQAYYGPPLAAIVPGAMAIAFVLLAPWSWRVLAGRPGGYALFALQAVAVVAVLGVALPRALGLGPTFLTDPGSLLVAVVLYLIGGWGLGRDLELELDLEHAQLKAVRTHLDPHFLFNTLNAIAEWCAEDPKVAEEATLRLSAILREILDGIELRAWPLVRELAVVRDLLELHRVRDPDAFSIAMGEAPPGSAIEVPPLVLASLVENAVKHGPRKGHRGPIVVRVVAASPVRLEVENPGPFAPSAEPGRGLALLRKRLALSYGARGRLDVRAIAGGRTLAAITVPA
jgi:two-component system sensor histidine kinase AlgZ